MVTVSNQQTDSELFLSDKEIHYYYRPLPMTNQSSHKATQRL